MKDKNYIEEVILILGAFALLTHCDFIGLTVPNFWIYSFERKILILYPIILLTLAGVIFYKKNYSKK